jgi:hypothetical protein
LGKYAGKYVSALVSGLPKRNGWTIAEHWLNWRRRHQALARWYHQRTRLARKTAIPLVR